VPSSDLPALPRVERAREVLDQHRRLVDLPLHGAIARVQNPGDFSGDRAQGHVVFPHPRQSTRALLAREFAGAGERPHLSGLRGGDRCMGLLDIGDDLGQRGGVRVGEPYDACRMHVLMLARTYDIAAVAGETISRDEPSRDAV
jgi:hypothetical protein